ncbi:hypothetical protein BJV77DRAFT_1036095, partial [Russula vinacea]
MFARPSAAPLPNRFEQCGRDSSIPCSVSGTVHCRAVLSVPSTFINPGSGLRCDSMRESPTRISCTQREKRAAVLLFSRIGFDLQGTVCITCPTFLG